MDEDFDVVEWRKENPMDYIKAMNLILGYSDPMQRTIAFNTIYKITRLHIPDTLYKFFSLNGDKEINKLKLETIERKQIYMADIGTLNDPFDNKAFYYNPERLSEIKRLAPHNGRLIDDFSTYVKISALTVHDYTSMPMWAHYANNHKGFCIAYDMKSKNNVQLSGCTFPIQYTDKRLDMTNFMEAQAQYMDSEINKQMAQGKKEILLEDLSIVFMATLFCNIKHKTWAYEKEFRCTTGAIAKGMPYVSATPKEIYIGLNCSDEHTSAIVEIAKTINVPAYRTVFNEQSPEFSLSLKQLQ